MARIAFTILLLVFFLNYGNAQNSVRTFMIIPQKSNGFNLVSPEKINPLLTLKSSYVLAELKNDFGSFISDLLEIQIPAFISKKARFIWADLSFSQMLETSFNNIKGNLVNTYDDHIAELYKDAPSIISLKYTIKL